MKILTFLFGLFAFLSVLMWSYSDLMEKKHSREAHQRTCPKLVTSLAEAEQASDYLAAAIIIDLQYQHGCTGLPKPNLQALPNDQR